MTIVSPTHKTSITWHNAPCEGKPLTREWTGPDRDGGGFHTSRHGGGFHTSRHGTTPARRDQEIAALLAPLPDGTRDWNLA